MKKSSVFLMLLATLGCLSSCTGQYYENSFFSNNILQSELLPNLPKPEADSMVFVQRGALNKNRVYVDARDETSEDYFSKVLSYALSLAFDSFGTIHSIKDENPVLGVDSSYYFHSTRMLSSILPSNYYFDEENAYVIAYSNGETKLSSNGVEAYIDDAHMLKVVDKGGTYQYNDFVYDYDYYIEFSNNPNLWIGNEDHLNNETKTLHLMVGLDYGIHMENKVTTLVSGNFIWFNIKDYGIDNLVAGDELVIKYTGEYLVQEIYPGSVDSSNMKIKSVELIKAEIAEFKLLIKPGTSELELKPVDSKYNQFALYNNEGYVVSQDGSFKKYNEYPYDTTIWATLPRTTGSVRVDGLYDYNPREEIPETGQFNVTVVDEGNFLIEELSCDSGRYTPSKVLEFYSYPIMDVDLAMYVNGEFYAIQDTIIIDDQYMWKYSFVILPYDVIIEFKTRTCLIKTDTK